MALQGATDTDVAPPLPVHKFDIPHPGEVPYESLEAHDEDNNLIRSASFTTLPQVTTTYRDGIKRTFSENVLSSPAHQPTAVSNSLQNANAELFRRASKKAKRRMSAFSTQPEDSLANEDISDSQKNTRTVSGTLKNLARKSWIPTRSASPLRKEEALPEKKKTLSPKKRLSFTAKSITVPEAAAIRRSSRSPKPNDENGDYFETHRRSSPAAQTRTRTLRDMGSRNNSVTSFHQLSRQSSSTSLKSRSSGEGLFLDVPGGPIPPLPTSTSNERHPSPGAENNRKKDPLWGAFRAIDGEYNAFSSKTSLQKVKAIRSNLLPFLTKHADHESSQSLRAEDLDRRVHILNRWWSGLLETLNGRSNQSISGTDRPAFLEAVTEIMIRPEWRIPPVPKDLSRQKTTGSLDQKASSPSEPEGTDFLIESIHQNIRNMFVQNLLSQMGFVVEKLSLRTAPASLINFGGKTCAYAFFFCPGVADMLVRLWHIPPGMLRRIFSEYGLPHNSNAGNEPEQISADFPPPIRSLSFTSQAALGRHMQPRAQRPPGSEFIRWYGPWVNRWIGRDSDLFFVFVKYYHILICQFQPVLLPLKESLQIPGVAPVHAQLLVVLESTLYRHVAHVGSDPYQMGDGFEALAPLPMSIPNATRSISENRLVMLLRDLAGDSPSVQQNVSDMVIVSFEVLMRAATRRVSMYNSDACFVLCDLFEEVCPILSKYEQSESCETIFDWPFWIKVFQQMMQTHTTMTQIRVIALLYGVWTTLVADEERKRQVLIDWILQPAFLKHFFCHWSSMVRHYFLRLLCWRVARCDGNASELDQEVLQVLILRLNYFWSHHQYLLADAEMRGTSTPSSEACSPAPGRSLVIIRTDTIVSPQFSTFDKILTSNQGTSYRNHSSVLNNAPGADQIPVNNKKRWNLFRSINPFSSSPGNPRPGEVTPPTSPESAVHDPTNIQSTAHSNPPTRPSTPPYQSLSFKFSLEYSSNRPSLPENITRLPPPTLPNNSQKIVEELVATPIYGKPTLSLDLRPLKPQGDDVIPAKYSGRALAEWTQVVGECQNFYTRRKQEGCPRDSLVETPTMAVESFRMFG